MGSSGNLQGLLKCFDLDTGWVVVRRSFKVLPIPDRVVKLANCWGQTSCLTARHGTGLDFVNRVGKAYD